MSPRRTVLSASRPARLRLAASLRARRPDPTRPWYVRVMDSTSYLISDFKEFVLKELRRECVVEHEKLPNRGSSTDSETRVRN